MGLTDWIAKTSIRFNPSVSGLRSRLAQDPYYRFQSFDEVRIAAQLGIQIDVNQATVDDWLRLPSFPIRQARLLMQLTQSGVQFHAVDDLAAALGTTAESLKPLLPILSFRYYDPHTAIEPKRWNINQATVEQLAQIPPVDLFLARAIAHQRQTKPYQDLMDLQERLNLSPALTGALMHYIYFQ